MVRFLLTYFFLLLSLTSLPAWSQTNCVVFNEVLINGAGACDGNCNPDTEEWIELYNNCSTPVDIGCWVIGDGDYTVTIPSGTILPAGAYFVIGSNNSPVSVDLNISSCNCTAGSPLVIGTLTNGNEQLILFDDVGGIADAIQWGMGQFPVSVSSPSLGSCNGININFNNTSSIFELLPQGGGNGCTMARQCDGSLSWEERCGSAITGGASNGTAPVLSFSANQQNICSSQCIDFFDQSSGTGITSWQWSFPGSGTLNSSLQNPIGICYPTPGIYDVSLDITNGCGTFSLLLDSFITVNQLDSSVITLNGSTVFCLGDSVLITASGLGPYQWLLDGQTISNASDDSLFVLLPGSYALISGTGACADTSAPVVMSNTQVSALTLTVSPSSILCQGDSVLLSVNNVFNVYSFILNNNIISNQTDTFLYVNQPGDYLVIGSSGACSDTSGLITLSSGGAQALPVTSLGNNPFCEGDSLLLFTPGNQGAVQWLLDGVQITGANDTLLYVSNEGFYSYVLNAGSSCEDTSQAVFADTLSAPSPMVFSSAGGFICPGAQTILASNQYGVSFSWLLNGSPLTQNPESLVVSQSGSYQLLVQYANGCSALSDVMLILPASLTPPGIATSSSSACPGDSVRLFINPSNYTEIQWSNGQEGSSITITESGIFSVQVTSPEGCTANNSISFTFSSLPLVDAGTDLVNACGAGVDLSGFANVSDYAWFPQAGLSAPSSLNTLANPVESTYYVLIARLGACENSDTVYVTNSECDLFLPDAFSPNGDSFNDVFRAQGPPLAELHIGIYDRWGNLVAELKSYDDFWNGEIEGKPASSGVYQWVIFQAVDLRGQVIQAAGKSKGNLSLLR